jgi:anthranilate phosphoribosyltransferase
MALRVRGETVEEISGAVATMRAKMLPVEAPADAIDIVGTGGDASGSYNVSTAAAFVAAGAGIPVAKHGNRALSSRSGAADTLAALGVNIEATPGRISACIREAGVGFMFAPSHHSAMRHVGPTRVELGTRTIFNLLGPLSNPAGVKRQLVGVFSPEWVEPLAHVLKGLGTEAAWVVHGDGLDEMTTAGPTTIAELRGGAVRSFEISPEDAGLPRVEPADLKGGDAMRNAEALRAVLDGVKGPYRDIVLLNAGAAILVAGKAASLRDGIAAAAASIDGGKARAALTKLAEVSNRPG